MADNQPQLTLVGRTASGRFGAGNPGRPKGAKGRHSRMMLERVKAMGDDAMTALFEAVKRREKWAVEFVLLRILPNNARSIEFEGMTPDDVSEALKNGDITPAEAKEIATALAKLMEISDVAELKAKLAELEQAVNAKG